MKYVKDWALKSYFKNYHTEILWFSKVIPTVCPLFEISAFFGVTSYPWNMNGFSSISVVFCDSMFIGDWKVPVVQIPGQFSGPGPKKNNFRKRI